MEKEKRKPGRPKTKGRDPIRSVRVPADEWEAWKMAAAEKGVSVSRWLRALANRRCKRTK